ncbi:MAG: adenosylcobinamide-phosphate synthase CbiB, partial [Thermodesulfovibrionales bacterium]
MEADLMSPAFISIKESLGIEGVQIGLAFLIDLLVGDPRWLPHPVRFMGFLIERLEFILRKVLRGAFLERIGGLLLVLFMVSFIFLFSCLVVMLYGKLLHSLNSLGRVLSSLFFVFLLSTTIATRGLASACIEVIGHLKEGNLFQARRSLSMIVGRDTENLSEEGVLRATLESLSENLSDGVIAPLFYLTIGGLPLAMTYKAINTMDSMIGYKNERYRYFGWAAARLDDIVNYIPARLSAALIIIATFLLSATVPRTHCRRNGLAIGYTLPLCSGCGALSFRRSIV